MNYRFEVSSKRPRNEEPTISTNDDELEVEEAGLLISHKDQSSIFTSNNSILKEKLPRSLISKFQDSKRESQPPSRRRGETVDEVVQKFRSEMMRLGYSNAKAKPDGNCLFNAMSIIEYGHGRKHAEVRSKMYREFLSIFNKYKDCWGQNDYPTVEECRKNDEAYFVYKIKNESAIKYDIVDTLTRCFDEGVEGFEYFNEANFDSSWIPKFINLRQEKCKNAGDMKRWGSLVDFHLYALVFKKNVRVLRTFLKDNVVEISGDHQRLIKFNIDISHEIAFKNSELFLYSNSNHYDPIPKLDDDCYWECSTAFT